MDVLASPSENFNSPDRHPVKEGEALRRDFLRFGAALYDRGPQPVAQFIAELAGLSPEVADEIRWRLEAYLRFPVDIYEALGGNRFVPYLVPIRGGKS